MKRTPLYMLATVALVASLAGCNAMNAYTGAAINSGEASYAGAKQNLQAVDDAKLIAWTDSACAIPIGALRRNATGNPDAPRAILTACPIPGLALVSVSNGTVSMLTLPTLTAPTPTPGYVAPKAATTTSSSQ